MPLLHRRRPVYARAVRATSPPRRGDSEPIPAGPDRVIWDSSRTLRGQFSREKRRTACRANVNCYATKIRCYACTPLMDDDERGTSKMSRSVVCGRVCKMNTRRYCFSIERRRPKCTCDVNECRRIPTEIQLHGTARNTNYCNFSRNSRSRD